jgi:predicted nucleic acid-binding protein
MSDRAFVDTNVLVYAHDVDAGERHLVAARLVAELWETRRGVISTQVLQEFYVNATRKIPSPLPRAIARQVVKTYAVWQTEILAPPDIHLASELEEQHQLSFWDALILVAAVKGGASTILTEDMSPGRSLSGVRIENPFGVGRGRRPATAPRPR